MGFQIGPFYELTDWTHPIICLNWLNQNRLNRYVFWMELVLDIAIVG